MSLHVHFHVNQTHFYMKGFARRLFETQAHGNSKMAYYRVIFQPVRWLAPRLTQEGYVSQSLDHLIVCVWTEICFRVRITRRLPWKTRTMRCKLSVKWENNKRTRQLHVPNASAFELDLPLNKSTRPSKVKLKSHLRVIGALPKGFWTTKLFW